MRQVLEAGEDRGGVYLQNLVGQAHETDFTGSLQIPMDWFSVRYLRQPNPRRKQHLKMFELWVIRGYGSNLGLVES